MGDRKSVWLVALLLVVTSVLLRWPSLPGIWSLDEANTCIFSQHILKGEVLYRDITDTRTPLLAYLLAVEGAVIGDWNLYGQHLVQAVVIGLCALLLWRISARLGFNGAGAWAAVVFTLLQFVFLHPLDAFGVTPEWYVVFFSALGFWLLALAWYGPRKWLVWPAGMSLGLSYLTKQPGLFDFATAVVWIGLFVAFDPTDRRKRLLLAGGLIAGFFAVVCASALYFAVQGAWKDYTFYAWTYSSRYYLPEVSTLDRFIRLRMPFRLAWDNTPLLGIGGVIGAALLLRGLLRSLRIRLSGQEFPLLALGWAASGVLGSGLSGREYGHYCIQVFPGLSLLCGWALHSGWSRARTNSSWRAGIGYIAVLLPVAVGVWQSVQRLRSLEELPRNSIETVGAVVRANTTPTDRIFTWGFYPEINYFAQRLSASRFVFANFLTGMIPWTNLAFDKDTAYAVVPGSWDQLWQDFEKYPPAVIVDTGVNRGYIKYPLERQTRLWKYIHEHYLEIEADVVRPQGFKVYRRTSVPLNVASNSTADSSLVLQEEIQNEIHSGIFHAHLPAGLKAAELLINGRSTGALSLEPKQTHQFTFTYLPLFHGKKPSLTIQAQRLDGSIVFGPVFHVTETQNQTAPSLIIGNLEFPPLIKECPAGMVWLPDRKVFTANAPTRLVFERSATLRSVDFSFGIVEGAYAPGQKVLTDGVELQVTFRPKSGPAQRLLTKAINPLLIPADRGPQPVHIDLPDRKPGELEIVISPGAKSDPSTDWSYISNLTGSAPTLTLAYGQARRLADACDAPLGIAEVNENDQLVVCAHAPCKLEFNLEPEMTTITGEFGILDSSWNTTKGQTPGLDFIAEQVDPEGRSVELWRHRLDPAHNPADRGHQRFRITLVSPVGGRLRLSAVPAHPPNNAFGYSYWANLVALPAP